MKHILIDMDGVGVNWHAGIYDALPEGLRVHFRDDTWDCAGPDAPDELLPAVRHIQAQPGFYLGLQPIEGFADAVRGLVARGYLVSFCSTPDSTNPTCADDKIAWLEREIGPGYGKRLILTHDKTQVRGDILIDDKPVITGALQPLWEHVVFDQPYNRGEETRRKPRVFRWSDTEVRALTFNAELRVGSFMGKFA